MNRRIGLLTAGFAVALVAGGGTALAASASSGPVNGNVITGCYTNAAINGSHVIVLQNVPASGPVCPSGTTEVQWNEQGPAGTNGTSVTAVSVAPAIGGSCTTGNTDILINSTAANNGEVYNCTASGWADSGNSIKGPPGSNGTNGAPGANGMNGTNGTSVTTVSVAPTIGGTCTNGDTDIVIGPTTTTGVPNGEVFTCSSSGWTDTGNTIAGPAGPAGPAGTLAGLSSLAGTPCDTASSTGSGYLSVSYGTPNPETGTDSVTIVCDVNNPNEQFSLNVDVTSAVYYGGFDCGPSGEQQCIYYGYGDVTSSDGLISCSGPETVTCSQAYTVGTTVTLTAAGEDDSNGNPTPFEGWTGCNSTSEPNSSGNDTVCSVTLSAPTTVTANFGS